jgi:membrane fusion protein (multidrug efflux system)
MKAFNTAPGILLIVLTTLLSSCSKEDSKSKNGDATTRGQVVNVKVEEIKGGTFVRQLQVTGIAKAIEDVNMAAEEGGIVKEWKVEKGGKVSKGGIVVILDAEVIRAAYEAALAQYSMADMNFRSQEEVYKEKGISEVQYKNLQFGRDAAKANMELMKARLDKKTLRSPIDGYLDDQLYEPGELAAPGFPIARVVNTSTIKVQAEIPELYSGAITTGTPVSVLFDAVPGETLTGKVSFVGLTVSASNRTMLVEILLPNANRKIKPEMVAKVDLIRQKKNNAILVSEDLIQLVDRNRYIVYVEKNGVAEERRLTIGGRQGNLVEVVEGLAIGDRLIVSGYQKLVTGSPVTITE